MTILCSGPVTVINYRCEAGLPDPPYVENHTSHFDYRTQGANFEVVAGSVLVGSPVEACACTQDHHLGGDQWCWANSHKAALETVTISRSKRPHFFFLCALGLESSSRHVMSEIRARD